MSFSLSCWRLILIKCSPFNLHNDPLHNRINNNVAGNQSLLITISESNLMLRHWYEYLNPFWNVSCVVQMTHFGIYCRRKYWSLTLMFIFFSPQYQHQAAHPNISSYWFFTNPELYLQPTEYIPIYVHTAVKQSVNYVHNAVTPKCHGTSGARFTHWEVRPKCQKNIKFTFSRKVWLNLNTH